jgi:hypothetical protein
MDLQKVLREIGTELLEQINDRRLADAIAKLAETQPDRSAIAKAVIPGIVEAIVEAAHEKTEPAKPILSAEADEPLIIGGAEFVPVYPGLCDEVVLDRIPPQWEVEKEAIYYHHSDGRIVLYNDTTEQIIFAGYQLGVVFYDGRWIIASEDLGEEHSGCYESIEEMIKALS